MFGVISLLSNIVNDLKLISLDLLNNFKPVISGIYDFYIENIGKKNMYIAIFITTILFILLNSKRFKGKVKNLKRILIDRFTNSEGEKALQEVERIMEEEHTTFEQAKDKRIIKDIMKYAKIQKTEWMVRSDLIIKQGDKVSFVDEECGFVQGTFLGIVTPDAVGYGDLYVIQKQDRSFRQAPLALIKKDTINVYKNK